MSTARKRFLLVGIAAAVALGVGIPTVLAGGGGGGKPLPEGVGPSLPPPTNTSMACDLPHSVIFSREQFSPDTTTSTSFSDLNNASVTFTLPSHPTKPHDPHPPAPWRYCVKLVFSAEIGVDLGNDVDFRAKLGGTVGAPSFAQMAGQTGYGDASTHSYTFIWPSVVEGTHTVKIQWLVTPTSAGPEGRVDNRVLDLSYSDPNNN